jgi:hypothetical protein
VSGLGGRSTRKQFLPFLDCGVWPRARTADDAPFKLGFVALDRCAYGDIVKAAIAADWLVTSSDVD